MIDSAKLIDAAIALLGAIVGFFGKMILDRFRANRASTLDHDRALFKKADAEVNEVFLNDLLNSHLYNHWCEHDDARRLGHFVEDFRREEHQFLDGRVRKAAHRTLDKLGAVDDFLAHHFFARHLGPEDHQLQLYPDLRDSGDDVKEKRYRDRAKELDSLCSEAWDDYKIFRSTVKRRLKV